MWLGVSFAIISRTRGETALARSAYQKGRVAIDWKGVARSFEMAPESHGGHWLFVPPEAPAWARDSVLLWSAAGFAERQRNAQEARRLDIQIPRGIPDNLVETLARAIYGSFSASGLAVQVDYHVKTARDGGKNPHLHGIISTRRIGSEGFARTKTADRPWNSFFRARRGKVLREYLCEKLNAFLEENAIDVRVDARRNSDRGLPIAQPRLPRAVFRHADSEYAKARFSEIANHRALRIDWEDARIVEYDAANKLASLRAELDEARRHCVSIRARSKRHRPLDLYAEIEEYALSEQVISATPVSVTRVTEDMLRLTAGSVTITVEDDWLCVDGECDDHALARIADLKKVSGWVDFDVVGTQQDFLARAVRQGIRRASRSLDPIEHWLTVYENDTEVAFAIRSRQFIRFSPEAAVVVDVIEGAEDDALQALRMAGIGHWQLYAAVQSLHVSAICYRMAQRSAAITRDSQNGIDGPRSQSVQSQTAADW